MKNSRLQVFRTAIDALVESLDAVLRLSRWNGPDARPEPLVAAAGMVTERLGVADRLSATRFVGPPADVVKVDAMCAAMKRLDAAYLAFRQGAEADPALAGSTLETEIAAITATSERWG